MKNIVSVLTAVLLVTTGTAKENNRMFIEVPKQKIKYRPYNETDYLMTKVSEKDVQCAVLALYHEARGESNTGIRMVFDTIMNRVNDARWPDTICDVIFQKKQFSFVEPEKTYKNLPKNEVVGNLRFKVNKCLSADNQKTTANHFLNPNKTRLPNWATTDKLVAVVGNHNFYRL